MKIVGGRFRGTQLANLSGSGARNSRSEIRPTTGRVRENMFNLLLNSRLGNCIAGVRVLDAFAGSGALGLEALSRGAASVHFIDNDPGACAVIRRNIARLRGPVPPDGCAGANAPLRSGSEAARGVAGQRAAPGAVPHPRVPETSGLAAAASVSRTRG